MNWSSCFNISSMSVKSHTFALCVNFIPSGSSGSIGCLNEMIFSFSSFSSSLGGDIAKGQRDPLGHDTSKCSSMREVTLPCPMAPYGNLFLL